MDKEKIYQNAAEYGELHEEDCCVNQEGAGSCDVGTPILGCCDKMKQIAHIIDDTLASVVEFISHDLECKDEAQRKECVRMYLEDWKEKQV